MEAPDPLESRPLGARSNVRRLVRLAALAAVVHAAACNSVLGNEERTLDDLIGKVDAGGSASDSGVDSGELHRIDNPVDASATDATTSVPDANVDAGLRMPDASCLKTSGMVSSNAVRKVEKDTSPVPVVTPTTVTASFTIHGDNALSNVHLDFCTPDGLKADVGGGTNFLGGGGAVTRRWQTKAVTTVPVGRVQAQVYSDDPPVLRYLTNIDLF